MKIQTSKLRFPNGLSSEKLIFDWSNDDCVNFIENKKDIRSSPSILTSGHSSIPLIFRCAFQTRQNRISNYLRDRLDASTELYLRSARQLAGTQNFSTSTLLKPACLLYYLKNLLSMNFFRTTEKQQYFRMLLLLSHTFSSKSILIDKIAATALGNFSRFLSV